MEDTRSLVIWTSFVASPLLLILIARCVPVVIARSGAQESVPYMNCADDVSLGFAARIWVQRHFPIRSTPRRSQV